MTSEEKLTVPATPWAKQFRDGTEVPKEFDEGDDSRVILRAS